MKIITTVLCILSCVTIIEAQKYKEMINSNSYRVTEIIKEAENYFKNKDKGKKSGYTQYKRWEYNSLRFMDKDGYLPTKLEVLKEIKNYNKYLNDKASRQTLPDNWTEFGPNNGNNFGIGRITSVAIDKNDSDHIIIGAPNGGVWKTTDCGQNWSNLTKSSPAHVYAIAIDPNNSNTYYYGHGGDLYKSIDRGITWSFLGGTNSTGKINKILIHPTNSNIIFISNVQRGILKSSNGGKDWNQVVTDKNSFDIEFKPNDPNTVYVSGSNFYKSLDEGNTFNKIAGFLDGPKMIGVSANAPENVYVIEAENYNGKFNGLYKSTNSGDSFTQILDDSNNYFGNSLKSDFSQAPRDMDIAINPNNENEIHIAGIFTYRSLDGGENFIKTSTISPDYSKYLERGYCHVDVDIMEFSNNTLFVGTDGGIFKAKNTSSNLSSNYYEDLTSGIGINEIYRIGISQTQNTVISSGSQDNGTSFYTQQEGWKHYSDGDGMETFIDKNNSNIMYSSSQNGYLYCSDDNGETYKNITPTPTQGTWTTPFEQDPITPNTIYVGYKKVLKSSNKGQNWLPISQDFDGNIFVLKIAPSNNNVMYLTSLFFNGINYENKLFKTIDGGATDWVEIKNPGDKILPINSITIHPNNPNKIAIATQYNVFLSNNGGKNWIDHTHNLPSSPKLTLIWDNNAENGLYVGTRSLGIFYIDDTFSEWQTFSNNLPFAIINELEINYTEGKIYAGTFGRGLWASPLVSSTLSLDSENFQKNTQIYPNPVNSKVTIKFDQVTKTAINIFDIHGKLLLAHKPKHVDDSYTLDVSKLNAGIFFVRVNSNLGYTTKKIIKN